LLYPLSYWRNKILFSEITLTSIAQRLINEQATRTSPFPPSKHEVFTRRANDKPLCAEIREFEFSICPGYISKENTNHPLLLNNVIKAASFLNEVAPGHPALCDTTAILAVAATWMAGFFCDILSRPA
jgi:hypothetical protein